jgi:hypothetical protein
MQTILKSLTFLVAAALPAAIAAELIGVPLPSALEPAHLFLGFVGALVAMTTVGDYSTARVRALRVVASAPTKAAHPLAA